jgi:LytS/YehU family sensor histidine kinase
MDIIAVYLTLYILFPLFLDKQKYLYFGFSVAVLIVLLIHLSALADIYIVYPFTNPAETPELDFSTYLHSFSVLSMFIGAASTLKLLKKAYHNRGKIQQIENERLEAELKMKEMELKLLRSQLHPHFLFNTMNNLYSLANDHSENTKDVILKISDLLSYILYDGNESYVSMKKELEFIKNFIDLEMLRYGDRLKLEMDINEECYQYKIAPMLLFTFVENSFKHGVGRDIGNPWLRLNMNVEDDHLDFYIENSVLSEESEQKGKEKSGIGIKNTKKRLDLLYPDKYSLKIDEKPGSFSVSLNIDLKS